MEKLRTDTEAMITSLQEQMRQTREDKKVNIEQRIADIKANFNARSSKFKQAQVLAKEAHF